MTMKGSVCIFGVLIICAYLVGEVKCVEYYSEKPAFLTSCRISEPEFSKCSRNTVQQLLDQMAIGKINQEVEVVNFKFYQYITPGIPEILDSFGPFDPMRVRDVKFKQDNNDAAQIRVNLTNIIVKGFSEIQVKESRVSKKDFSWHNRLLIPKMRLDADYNMNGRILLIPLNGAGKLFFEIENMDINMLTETRLYDKGGFTFDNVTNVRVKLNMTRVRTQLDNLFNGNNKEIERSTNQFFNDNWRDFYEALKPVIVETVANIMFDIMYKVFNLIPANFFVEDIPTAEQFYGKQQTDDQKQKMKLQ